MSKAVYLSVVIPVYNEQECLETLYNRLLPVLDKLKCSFEVIFTNDGSKDRSSQILRSFFERRPQHIRVIEFNGNFGQHMAIMAAFERARGEIIINLDADLQNPPEEIPNLLKEFEKGHDYVGTYRLKRNDSWIRDASSKTMNYLRGKFTNIHIRDQGCMMRAYSRRIVDLITQCSEGSTFISALGYTFAINPSEIGIPHEPRREGESKYDLYRLVRVTFDLFTSFSLAPLHAFTVFGFIVSALSGVLVAYLFLRRLIIGPEAEGLFTLFAILYFLVSVAITGIGIVGEYVGRTYQVVRHHPRFLIREILEEDTTEDSTPIKKQARLK
ncbi:glycosyltransferase [Candidatus Nucleicultrix amoebiphila]|jgi:undecaprenyl-phosphate 4-deoxy-4-formamido-L-arabinose transferase|uniref:glycosyltransferase n=1 Tax=Candidatus Nucleicultrix amoebiphila TaxID=1509244 RepID=UPI000A269553|nr:glycosyltransferase [Candidatus Nucleicultrix amoebiphila]